MASHRPDTSPQAPAPVLDDPVFLHSRREALVILGLWLTATVYTLTTCTLLGYERDPADLIYVWGIPDWVFWGIFVPWGFCNLFTIWFCFWFVVEDDLGVGTEHASPSADASEGSPNVS